MFAEILAAGYAANLETIRRQWQRYHEENQALRERAEANRREFERLKRGNAERQNVITLKPGDYRIDDDEAPGPLTDPGALIEERER